MSQNFFDVALSSDKECGDDITVKFDEMTGEGVKFFGIEPFVCVNCAAERNGY